MSLHSELLAAGFTVIQRDDAIEFPRKWGAMSILAKHRSAHPEVKYTKIDGAPWVLVPGGFDKWLDAKGSV